MINQKEHTLWTERYRPKTVDEYVFRDENLKQQVNRWIRDNDIPHLLITGPPGTGKSSLVNVLLNNLDVNPGDVLYLNCSAERNADTIRDKVIGFAQTVPNGKYKIILLEEADYLTHTAQAIMRRPLEDYSESVRFILTGNYRNKFSGPMVSRFQEIEIAKLDQDEFLLRIATILLEKEGIEADVEVLQSYVAATYPDLRKCINTCQQNCFNGKLHAPTQVSNTRDWMIVAAELFKQGKISQGRKIVCDNITPDMCDEFFSMCYRNLDWWSSDETLQDLAIVVIRDSIVKNASVADVEINMAAMLIELGRIHRGEI
jgi:replication factor C small subunit